jgi:hypothetical protein
MCLMVIFSAEVPTWEFAFNAFKVIRLCDLLAMPELKMDTDQMIRILSSTVTNVFNNKWVVMS